MLAAVTGGDRGSRVVDRRPRPAHRVPDVAGANGGEHRHGRQSLGIWRLSGLDVHRRLLDGRGAEFFAESQRASGSRTDVGDVRVLAPRQLGTRTDRFSGGVCLFEPAGRQIPSAFPSGGVHQLTMQHLPF
jgi:hypothetical protein